jgi:hypothetical protein
MKLYEVISESAQEAGAAAIDNAIDIDDLSSVEINALVLYAVLGSFVAVTTHLNERLDQIEALITDV